MNKEVEVRFDKAAYKEYVELQEKYVFFENYNFSLNSPLQIKTGFPVT